MYHIRVTYIERRVHKGSWCHGTVQVAPGPPGPVLTRCDVYTCLRRHACPKFLRVSPTRSARIHESYHLLVIVCDTYQKKKRKKRMIRRVRQHLLKVDIKNEQWDTHCLLFRATTVNGCKISLPKSLWCPFLLHHGHPSSYLKNSNFT